MVWCIEEISFCQGIPWNIGVVPFLIVSHITIIQCISFCSLFACCRVFSDAVVSWFSPCKQKEPACYLPGFKNGWDMVHCYIVFQVQSAVWLNKLLLFTGHLHMQHIHAIGRKFSLLVLHGNGEITSGYILVWTKKAYAFLWSDVRWKSFNTRSLLDLLLLGWHGVTTNTVIAIPLLVLLNWVGIHITILYQASGRYFPKMYGIHGDCVMQLQSIPVNAKVYEIDY